MPQRLLHSTVVLLAIAATGCAAYPGALPGPSGPTPGTDLAGQPLSLSSLPKVGVSGLVVAPAHVVAAGGGNVVAAGGGNVIAAGGGNVVAPGGGNFAGTRRVLALDRQVAVAGAEVYMADMAGERLPDVPATFTDAAGRFTLRGAPEETAYMVVARFRSPTGAAVTLTRLGHAGRGGHEQVVSVATTLVSTAMMQRGTPAARFDPDAFEAAVTAVADRLDEATMPDLTRPEDVAAKAAAIAEDTPAVRRAIDEPAAPQGQQPAPAVPAAEPLIDEVPHAAPAAPSSVHKGKSHGKAAEPSGPPAPPSETAPDATGGEAVTGDTPPGPSATPKDEPPKAESPEAAPPQPQPADHAAPWPKQGKGADKADKGNDKEHKGGDKGADKEKPGPKGQGKGGKPD
jgi:hypothetical protein